MKYIPNAVLQLGALLIAIPIIALIVLVLSIIKSLQRKGGKRKSQRSNFSNPTKEVIYEKV